MKGNDKKPGLESLDTEGSDQYLPRERRDITYVSRLQVQCIRIEYLVCVCACIIIPLAVQGTNMCILLLQCVKDAVDKQLSGLTKEYPNRRAILITFSDEVS